MGRKRRLVVVGNGMAGARAVEEILARGGADQFEISMFGDEPYGNHNRILLSDVLNGSHEEGEIFLNPLAWYEQNGIRLHAGVRATNILRSAQHVVGENGVSEPYDDLIIATGSLPFIPPIKNATLPDGRLRPGVFAFRNLDDCRRITSHALGQRRAAVIGGGLQLIRAIFEQNLKWVSQVFEAGRDREDPGDRGCGQRGHRGTPRRSHGAIRGQLPGPLARGARPGYAQPIRFGLADRAVR